MECGALPLSWYFDLLPAWGSLWSISISLFLSSLCVCQPVCTTAIAKACLGHKFCESGPGIRDQFRSRIPSLKMASESEPLIINQNKTPDSGTGLGLGFRTPKRSRNSSPFRPPTRAPGPRLKRNLGFPGSASEKRSCCRVALGTPLPYLYTSWLPGLNIGHPNSAVTLPLSQKWASDSVAHFGLGFRANC